MQLLPKFYLHPLYFSAHMYMTLGLGDLATNSTRSTRCYIYHVERYQFIYWMNSKSLQIEVPSWKYYWFTISFGVLVGVASYLWLIQYSYGITYWSGLYYWKHINSNWRIEEFFWINKVLSQNLIFVENKHKQFLKTNVAT